MGYNTLVNNPYYKEMLHKGRLIPFFTKDRLVCFITFYITNNPEKYLRDDMWSVEDDDKNGSICWIDQLWTDKEYENRKLSYEIWHRFKIYIKNSFSSVQYIYWRRWDKRTQTVKTYKKEM